MSAAASMPSLPWSFDSSRYFRSDPATGFLRPKSGQTPAIDAQNEKIWNSFVGTLNPYGGNATPNGSGAPGPDSVLSGWTPTASYVPNPIQVTPDGVTQQAPAPSSTQSSGSDSSSSSPPAQAQAPAQPTPWELWQQQSTSATGSPPPTSQTAPTIRKEGARNSILANAVLSGGTTYQPGKTAAAFNQDVANYQQQQNEFSTTYQLMLNRLAQEAGGINQYTPGATG